MQEVKSKVGKEEDPVKLWLCQQVQNLVHFTLLFSMF